MTRSQYIMLCIVGGIAITAYLETMRIAKELKALRSPSPVNPVSGTF